jgi:S1-C subfamily serine protease
MKKITFIIMAIILSFGGAVNNDTLTTGSSFTQVTADSADVSWISNIRRRSSLSKVESNVRNSSVRVEKPDGRGYGSGTYGYYDNQLVVFTAQHVVDDNIIMIIHGRDGEVAIGVVVYTDVLNDFAILKVDEMKTREPIVIKPVDDDLDTYVGWHITYTGFPSGYDLLTITGRIAGLRTDGHAVVAHSFTWMGASGSGVFNSRGEYVGPLVAVGLGRFQVTQIVEDMVWIIPATNLDWDAVSEALLPFE